MGQHREEIRSTALFRECEAVVVDKNKTKKGPAARIRIPSHKNLHTYVFRNRSANRSILRMHTARQKSDIGSACSRDITKCANHGYQHTVMHRQTERLRKERPERVTGMVIHEMSTRDQHNMYSLRGRIGDEVHGGK